MEIYQAVETVIGVLSGRDAIYLNALEYDGNTLFLHGAVNGNLATKSNGLDYFYSIEFCYVLAVQIIELDSWLNMDYSNNRESSFDEVINSRWIAILGGKVTPAHKHYSFMTYDDVIEVVCRNFELELRLEF